MSTEKILEEFNHWYDNERKKAAPFSTVNIRDKCFESWQASRTDIEVELREAYQKGWDASGEGWNAEYPGDAHIRESWQLEREKSLGLKVKP
ncbi:hypothetical protein [Pseudomonas sp. OVF7]|uniref:hypothetical protein n=1 Tax=unclassified Pseudomonas TaxID=196821 RepID=UPI00272C207A|nr:hypothetical protein [Pseudomonas sp. OVF7]WLD64727.1 hypothetical protein QU606_20465 [Pseudomonas sp. OVF7]